MESALADFNLNVYLFQCLTKRCQTLRLYLKCIWEEFGMVGGCVRKLMLDKHVFQICSFVFLRLNSLFKSL